MPAAAGGSIQVMGRWCTCRQRADCTVLPAHGPLTGSLFHFLTLQMQAPIASGKQERLVRSITVVAAGGSAQEPPPQQQGQAAQEAAQEAAAAVSDDEEMLDEPESQHTMRCAAWQCCPFLLCWAATASWRAVRSCRLPLCCPKLLNPGPFCLPALCCPQSGQASCGSPSDAPAAAPGGCRDVGPSYPGAAIPV